MSEPMDEDAPLRPGDREYDAAEQDAVRRALREWGQSLTADPLPTPPPHVWSQVTAAVESARPARRLRALPGGRWTTPLVAASVVGLAVVIGSNVLGPQGEQEAIVVAGAESAAVPVQEVATAGPRVLQAGFVPPARKVMQLGEELTTATVAQKVDELLEDVGVDEPVDVLAMPEEDWQPSADGLTSDPQVLRDCVTKVTKVATSQALLVLRATVNGVDAGLIVVPEFMQDMNAMADMDADDMRQMGSQLGVTTIYVVEPTCGTEAPEDDPTLLQVSFTLAP